MTRYLKEHFGVVGAIPASANVRSTDYTADNHIAAVVAEAEFETQFQAGQLFKSSEAGALYSPRARKFRGEQI